MSKLKNNQHNMVNDKMILTDVLREPLKYGRRGKEDIFEKEWNILKKLL